MAVTNFFEARGRQGRAFLFVLAALVCLGFSVFADDAEVADPTTYAFQHAVWVAETNATPDAPGTVIFTIDGTLTLTNAVIITNSIIIDGQDQITIDGNAKGRVLTITNRSTLPDDAINVTLQNFVIFNGRSTNGGGIYIGRNVNVTLDSMTFSANNATNAPGTNGANATVSGNSGGNGVSGLSTAGGAVYNLGNLTISSCVFSNNTALGANGGKGGNGANDPVFGGNGGNGGNGGSGLGGAIYSSNQVTITETTFSGNICGGGNGGAPGSAGNGQFPGNTGKGGSGGASSGGAIYSAGLLEIGNCTFVQNTVTGGTSAAAQLLNDGTSGSASAGGAASGAGVYNLSQLFITNCTFFQNSAQGGGGGNTLGDPSVKAGNGGAASGGAVYNANATTNYIVSCTLATNNVIGGTNGISPIAGENGSVGSALGGNVFHASGSTGTNVLRFTILAQGTGTNVSGTFGDGGYNLVSDKSWHVATNSTTVTNTDPMLDTDLKDNGGPPTTVGYPLTIALLRESPAIDRIPLDTPDLPDTDERGTNRVGNADVGAFEAQGFLGVGGKVTMSIILTNGLTTNSPASGVTFRLLTGGVELQTTTSSDTGAFSFENLGSASYNVQPDAVGAATMTPSSANVDLAGFSVRSLKFNLANGAIIAGHVSDATGSNNIAGLSLHITNIIAAKYITNVVDTNVVTALDGTYAFTNLPGGTYVIIPNQIGAGITPTIVTNFVTPGQVISNVNFIATAPQFIGGRAVSGSNGLAGISIRLTNSTVTITNIDTNTTTLADGSFLFTNLPAGTYMLIPSQTGLGFTPTNFAVAVPPSGSNVVTFYANAPQSISGTVTDSSSNAIADVTITIQGTGNSTTTAGDGSFSFNNLAGGSYTLVPAKSGFTFSPTNATVNIASSTNSTNYTVKFTANSLATISGSVTHLSTGVDGISIHLSDTSAKAVNQSTTTAGGGFFAFTNLAPGSNYIVTVTQVGSGTTPTSTHVTIPPNTNIIFTFNPPQISTNTTGVTITNSTVKMQGVGAPSQPYHLQISTTLTNWTTGDAVTANTNGVIDVTTTNVDLSAPAQFFRITAP